MKLEQKVGTFAGKPPIKDIVKYTVDEHPTVVKPKKWPNLEK